MSDFYIRYVIVKKYITPDNEPSVKVDAYKYWKKDQMLVEDIRDAHLFASKYDAEHALKFTKDEGIFQIEKIYIKT